MPEDIFEVRRAEEADRRPLALLFAAVAEDGIAAEPPVDVDKRAASWDLGARDLHKLTLSVFPHNDAAIAVYRKFGFVGNRVKPSRVPVRWPVPQLLRGCAR